MKNVNTINEYLQDRKKRERERERERENKKTIHIDIWVGKKKLTFI